MTAYIGIIAAIGIWFVIMISIPFALGVWFGWNLTKIRANAILEASNQQRTVQ